MKLLFKSLLLIYKYSKWPAYIVTLIIIGSGVMTPLTAFFTKRLIDTGVNELKTTGNLSCLVPWIIALLIVMLLYNLQDLGIQIFTRKIDQKLRDNLIPVVTKKFSKLEYAYFEDAKTKDLLNRIGINPENALKQVLWQFLYIPQMIVQLIGLIIIFASAGWWVIIGCLIIGIPVFIISIKDAKDNKNLFYKQTKDERKVGYISNLITSRQSAKELRIYNLYKYLNQKWHNGQTKLLKERINLVIKQQKRRIIKTVLQIIFISISLIMFCISIQNDRMSYGLFVALAGQLPILVNIITTSMPDVLIDMSKRVIFLKDFDKFLSLPEIYDGSQNIKENFYKLEFKNVHFTYPNTNNKILNGISFTLRRGEKLAIVGDNGAGKSTIIKLLLGLYTPDSGTIMVNNIDTKSLSTKTKRKLFSAVFQDFCCYNLTLRENIALGNITELNNNEKILKATEKGTAQDIVNTVGLDTNLGKVYDDGTDLSYGQWQRIAISRGIMADSDIIILDEPTAAVDPIAEAEIYNSFINSTKDKSCILISHRLGSARLVDRILVIHNGIVVENGNHNELIKSKGIYNSMFKAQSKWYKEGKVS